MPARVYSPPYKSRTLCSAIVPLALVLGLSTACQQKPRNEEDLRSDDTADMATSGPSCLGDALPLQNPRGHTLGETFYLPPAKTGAGCPDKGTWEVAKAPSGSSSKVHVQDGFPWPHFTADLEGDYLLRLREAPTSEVTLTVVRRTPKERFRNHYLTPLFGMAKIGEELYVANGASYTLSRLKKQGEAGELSKVAEIPVGTWPAAVVGQKDLPYVLVANRGSDTIGFVDLQKNVQDAAVWVGDEPTGLALAPDGKRLYVSLPTQREVAVVDLGKRSVSARVSLGFDPRALALSADGKRLFVASYRSGNLQDGPGKMRKAEDDQDIWIINTETLKVDRTVLSVSADLRALSLSADGSELYIAATDGDTVVSQADPMAKPFVHQVVVLGADPAKDGYGKVLRSADLSRQPSAAGKPFVNPAGVLQNGDLLWVSAESSNEVLALDLRTLEEKRRVSVCAGARHLLPLSSSQVAVHCYRSSEVSVLDEGARVLSRLRTTEDPRPQQVTLGEEVFYRPGGAYAQNHSCASCHIETQNDGMVWNFGPRVYHNVRPLSLLEATTPIEWGAYVSNTANFGYQGPASIVARPATQEESYGLAAFLGSLIGAPRATGATLPDGSYSEPARRGQALFSSLGCSGCHTPGLYTSRRLISMGKSGEPADVPSLLGVYRHGVYMVKGQARSLEDAVTVALLYLQKTPTADERADLLRFLKELTPKGAAPLGIWPDLDSAAAVAPDVVPWVRFAGLVDGTRGDRQALAQKYVVLQNDKGEDVAGQVRVEGDRLSIKPSAPLAPGSKYRFRVKAGLPFEDGGVLEIDRVSDFTVAQPQAGELPKNLKLTVFIPPMGGGMPMPVSFDLTREDGGNGALLVRYAFGPSLTQQLFVQISADKVYLQGFALPLGPRGIADAGNVQGTVTGLSGDDKNKTISKIEGTFRIGAPGINIPGVRFEIVPK